MPMVLEPDREEAPYQGRAGQTRLESVHVPLPDRTLRTVRVHRAVNVSTDPHLREAALSGTLHRVEGVELAISFVYHDPAERKLALVVPESLRHEELRERARLLEMLAAETGIAVPRYASEAVVVIGHAQLAEHLARPPGVAIDPTRVRELEHREQELAARERASAQREQSFAQREQAVSARELALQQREQKLRERAEEVTRREDELASSVEMHEAAQRDLAVREQELAQRLEALQQREQELAARSSELDRRDEAVRTLAPAKPPMSSMSSRPPPPVATSISGAVASALSASNGPSAGGVLAVEIGSLALAPARVPMLEAPGRGDEHEDEDGEVEEIDDLEPIRTSPGTGDSIAAAIQSTTEAVGDRLSADETVEELVDDEDVEEEVDESDIEGDGPSAELVDEEPNAREAADLGSPSTDPGIAKPAELRGETQMIARTSTDGVDLFVSVGDREGAFEGESDLLIQLVLVEGTPVVLLTLVDPAGLRPFVRRAALDPRSSNDRRVLEALRRRFEARIVTFGGDDRFLRSVRVSAPRELNAARVLDRVSRQRGESVPIASAIERALAEPPPISGGHPFTIDEEPGRLETAAKAAAVLAELAEWATPEKMDHAVLVLSVPRDTIDTSIARALEKAIAHGLALSPGLADRAIAAGLAPDPPALVGKQIAAFRATAALDDRGGLSPEQIASTWEKLLAAAADGEVALDGETHDLAWRAIREVRGEQTGPMPGGGVDPARLAAMHPPELVMLLEHPKHRRLAAIALCDRADPQFAEALCKAVRKMPRAEVVRIVPRITKLGDEAGDALIDGLGARKTFARQAFALALGHLKLRRAVVPLLHLLISEPTDVWKEVARVFGTFGNASFRTLSQKLHDPKAPEDRFALALAHLSNHGCTKQVEALEKDPDRRVAEMARRARDLKGDAKRQDESASGKRVLEGADPVVAFSRRFAEELEGTAPEADLAGDDT